MRQRSPIVRALDAHTYSNIAGKLHENLPGKVIFDIDRAMGEKGKSIVVLRCKHPELAKQVIARVLGEEYISPKVDDDLPLESRTWWQRSINSGIGGGRSRDAGDIRRSMDRYIRRSQDDIEKTRRRVYGGTRESKQ